MLQTDVGNRSDAAPSVGLATLPDQGGQIPPAADVLPQPDQCPPAAQGGAPPHEAAAKEHLRPAEGSGVGSKRDCEEEEEEDGAHSVARPSQPGSLTHPDLMADGETMGSDSGGSGAGLPASLQQQPGSLNPDPAAGGSHPASLNPDPGGSESQRGGTLPDSYSGCLPELRREANRIHKGGWAGGGREKRRAVG